MSDEQDWARWLDTVIESGVNLSSFEIDFIESLDARRGSRLFPGQPGALHLSEKQAALLERIYADRTP